MSNINLLFIIIMIQFMILPLVSYLANYIHVALPMNQIFKFPAVNQISFSKTIRFYFTLHSRCPSPDGPSNKILVRITIPII